MKKHRMGTYLLAIGMITIIGLLAANLIVALAERPAPMERQKVSTQEIATSITVAPSADKPLSSLISTLQQSVVKIEMPGSRGSGIILNHEDGKTIILTNKHVIDPAKQVKDIDVSTADHVTFAPMAVYVAPKQMDLAIVVIEGTHGVPVQIVQEEYDLGDDVLALGSPRGIQGSVSKGIVSNFGDDRTKAGYTHSVIQTDTAINTGNSGGGLFLASTGALIGINTFQMKNAEGLNFAIDIHELERLERYTQWERMQ